MTATPGADLPFETPSARILAAAPQPLSQHLRPLLSAALRPLAQLEREVRAHLESIRRAATTVELIDLPEAERLAADLVRLIQSLPSPCPPEQHRAVQLAASYFTLPDDDERDISSPIGFDDDRVVFDLVAAELARDATVAAPRPSPTTSKTPPRRPTLAPGARVEIRDEEWMVRSAKWRSPGGLHVHVTGVSELVRGKEAIFLSELDEIRELRPEETKLVADDSPQYRRSRLYLDALLRRSPATDTALYVGHRAAIRRANYQLQPAAKALRQLRPRILFADGVGLGKTVEVGVLLSELIQRGRAERILVVALKSILTQFQKELWARFTIPLVRLDSVGIQRVQSRVPSNMNPFYYFDRVIISIDTLKRDEKYRRYLEECRWDVVVVDECQHVAVRTTGSSADQSQRARLAQLLGRTADALILTSATPHDGRPESFASLMNLLEPTAIVNESDYTREEVEDLFIRRFKKDVEHEVQEAFRERDPHLVKEPASPPEDAVFDALAKVEFKTIARQRGGKGALFRTLLLKAFLSSPAACIATLENRLGHKDMQNAADPAVQHDREKLIELKELAEAVKPAQLRKLQALLQKLRELGFDQEGSKERVVIFSERIDTLEFLHEQLAKALRLKADQIALFHGTLDDQAQQGLVESFGTQTSPIRVLLASDAASEGINLHYYCHRLFHFDLPWSLITLEQRNGRIDRFGQTQTPELTYLLTIPSDPTLKGDLRVLERLIEKEHYAHKNLGDVAWLMALHDAEKEEDRIARGIESHESAEEVVPETPKHTDFLETLLSTDSNESAPQAKTPTRLIPQELAYARAAFQEVLGDSTEHVEWHEHLDGFTLHPPDDLLRRFDYLPSELRDEQGELKLTVDRQRVMDALDEARQIERKWPVWQLFWEQHPVAEWLDDRVLGKLGRHEAPVVRLAKGLAREERIFVFQGMVSNRRSQPVIVDWFGVRFFRSAPSGTVPLDQLIRDTGLDQSLANPGGSISPSLDAELSALRAAAVEEARRHMLKRRNDRATELGDNVRDGLRKVRRWRDQKLASLESKRAALLAAHGVVRSDQDRRLGDERDSVEKLYKARQDWIEDLRTVDEPYLRLAAVLAPQEVR